MLKRCLTVLIMIGLCSAAQAQTVYVTDTCEAPLRSGKTNAYRIMASLKSGTPLDLLLTDTESGYSQVMTRKDTQGWILTRHLIKTPVAKDRLGVIEQKMQQCSQQNSSLQTADAELREATTRLQNDNQALNELNNKLADELAYIQQVSGNSLNLNQRNKELIEENQQLKNRTDLLLSELSRIKNDVTNDFFLYGAGTIMLGIILGLFIPSLRPKRKDPGWV